MKHTDLNVESKEQEMAVKNCLMFLRVGSVMYGTNIVGKSDNDFVGVFMPDENYHLGLEKIEQVDFRTNSTASKKRNTAEDTDCTLYALDKFISLLLNNNPNTLETLFVPENCKLYMSSFAKKLVENANLFVSKKSYHSFKGYSHAQVKRLERSEVNETGRVELIKQFGYDTKMASHVLRLYLECNELLSTGNITLPLKENLMVLNVKKGEWNKEKFLQEAHRLETLCDSLYVSTKLRDTPDYVSASKLLMKMRQEYFGYGNAKNKTSWKRFWSELLHSLGDRLEA